MIGIISLIGIAVNNAIVMVETMNHHLRHGATVKEAAAQGGAGTLASDCQHQHHGRRLA